MRCCVVGAKALCTRAKPVLAQSSFTTPPSPLAAHQQREHRGDGRCAVILCFDDDAVNTQAFQRRTNMRICVRIYADKRVSKSISLYTAYCIYSSMFHIGSKICCTRTFARARALLHNNKGSKCATLLNSTARSEPHSGARMQERRFVAARAFVWVQTKACQPINAAGVSTDSRLPPLAADERPDIHSRSLLCSSSAP